MPLRMALAQINPTVGDIAANLQKAQQFCTEAAEHKADLIVFPEMSICGYPPEDLLLKKHFLNDSLNAVKRLAEQCRSITAIAGFAELAGHACFNSAAVLANGRIRQIYRKACLPNYGVFDERRYFQKGTEPIAIDINGLKAVLTICEDIWQLEWLSQFLASIPKIQLIINISSSPFHIGKINEREKILSDCCCRFNCPLAYCNIIGGQDELVFDGRSMFFDSAGRLISQAKAFQEDLLIADIDYSKNKIRITTTKQDSSIDKPLNQIEEVYGCLLTGTRDYVSKNGFKKVLIGLSGGIDSSLVAAIAVEALGKQNVIGITMPSQFNTSDTISDAGKTAKNLDIEFHTIPINEILNGFSKTLSLIDGWNENSIAYENLQARIRGTILMSLSNHLGAMVLTTGNKSETAVGYTTLYGDTAGGFAVIKDVPKTMVYQLAEYINEKAAKELIPASVIKRPPSAELRADQKDSDSLPNYDLLDSILTAYIEQDKSVEMITKAGLPPDIVKKVALLVDRNEYKRRQSPPGIKITPKAFGRDRRMPITNRYKSS